MSIFSHVFHKNDGAVSEDDSAQVALHDLMRQEREVTSDLFGAVADGSKRDFYCLNEDTWVWYEEWNDQNGHAQYRTTRYTVLEDDIVKSQNGGDQVSLNDEELRNFAAATKSYTRKVSKRLYANI